MRISRQAVSRRAPARSASGRCSSASVRCAIRRTARASSTSARCARRSALEHGWLKEGSPTTPACPTRAAAGGSARLAAFFEPRRPVAEPVVDEPILRRLSGPELAMVEAADLFNASAFRRTVAGLAKSLGQPKASIVPLSGVEQRGRPDRRVGDLVVPVPDHSRLGAAGAPRGARAGSGRASSAMFTSWNARLAPDGRIVPEIPPV